MLDRRPRRADLELPFAGEREAVGGADDRARGDNNGGEAEENKRDDDIRRDQPGQRNRGCGRDVASRKRPPQALVVDVPAQCVAAEVRKRDRREQHTGQAR